jgi:L-ascorbate metabolism protein UlaG (beta-lactamase superfamily)
MELSKFALAGPALCLALFLAMILAPGVARAAQTDTINTPAGPLAITFLGHGSLYFTFGGKVIQVDPYSKAADYAALPKADLVLITHEHQDHLDLAALDKITTPQTEFIVSRAVSAKLGKGRALDNGQEAEALGLRIRAVPAYNLVHMREPGLPYHPKGQGNGYIVDFAGVKAYIAGDTENIPEMAQWAGVDVAFLPVNLPYTMTPEMLADAAARLKPKVLYPYHTGDTDMAKVAALLAQVPGVETRIRDMK